MNKIILLLPFFILAGCSNNNHQDIQEWMKEKTKNEKGHIKPLPPAKSFIPIAFEANSDPFKEKPFITLNIQQTQYTPNPDRRKEPLEAYQLDNLKMKGTLIRDKVFYAMILAPDGTINYVSKNNYIGGNYGKIVSIDESQIVLDERIKNSNDEWQPRKTIISLDDIETHK